MPSIDLQTGEDFALPLAPLRPWALPRGPAPAAFRPCPPDQPSAVWMRALPGALAAPRGEQIMTGKKRSEKRKTPAIRKARFTPEEAARFDALAEEYGGASAFIRNRTLNAPLPRHKVDKGAVTRLRTELAKVRAELGKSGSNLNQIAYHLNAGRPGDIMDGALASALAEHEQAIRTLEELRLVILQSLGFERDRKPPKKS